MIQEWFEEHDNEFKVLTWPPCALPAPAMTLSMLLGQGLITSNQRVVILGKTGSGKSSLANTIFGEETFKTNHTADSETGKCQAETKSVNGQSITLIDTPGFFDTKRSEEDLKPEIVRCITGCAPGPHAFLILLKVEKYSEHEQSVITEIKEYFSEAAFKYATVVFTYGDQLQEGQTVDDFVHHDEILSELYSLSASNQRVVIWGKTGSGKSSLANTIFGEETFKINHTSKSETSECKAVNKSVNGRSITLIDTPGFFDTKRFEEDLKPEILRCIIECTPGPHAFLILLKVDKYSEHEQAVITKIKEYFSEEAFKYATVVFTHGDQLPEGQTIDDFVHHDEILRDLVKKCGGRCHVIDNKYWNKNTTDEYRSNQFQVEQLLKTIDKMIKNNNDGCYTNEMLQEAEKLIQQESEHMRKTSGNMSEAEIREKAKGIVFKKLWIQLAGTATGMLVGAFFGVKIMVNFVLKALMTITQAGPKIQAGGIAVVAGGGGTAAVAGGGVAALSIKAVGVSVGASAAVGAVAGGFTGFCAAEKAETTGEAVQMAQKAVRDGANSITQKIDYFFDGPAPSKKNQ
uniref:GTPase IMAP family member 8-like n=1 Tax=Semicossyphus pulcher TaxID=241346 RepID=UPI0037E80190